MHALLASLVRLQTLELQIGRLRQALAQLPERGRRLEQSRAEARQKVEQARQRLLAGHKQRRALELDIEQLREKVRRYRAQLYEVKTNEAYRALQQEIQLAEATITRLEDQLLEQMVAAEELDRQVHQAEGELQAVEAQLEQQAQQLQREQQRLQQELEQIEHEAATVRSGLPEDVLDHYRRIARRHGGLALAAVRDEACSLCRVRVRPHVLQLLQQPESAELFHCESCTRILYLPESETEPAVAPLTEAGGERS